MKRSTNRKRWIVGLMGVLVALCLVPVVARAVDGAEPSEPQAGEAVARIGDVEYATLDEAVQAAEDGATIELLGDAETSGMNLSKSLTIKGAEGLAEKPVITFVQDGIALWAKSLSFIGCDVTMNGIGSTPYAEWKWMAVCLSGASTLTLDNCTWSMDATGVTNDPHAIYVTSPDAVVNVVNKSSLTIKNYTQDAVEWDGSGNGYSFNVTDSTFVADGNRSGLAGTFTVSITRSTFSVLNSRGNGSNGSHFIIDNSNVEFNENGSHGLSAGKLEIKNHSSVAADHNGYRGVTMNSTFEMDGTSKLDVTHNSWKGDYAGLKTPEGGDGHIAAGAVVTITDNYCSGLSNNRKLVIEEGVKLVITGNTNDQGGAESSHGGGIYNSGSSANLTLPSDAVIYNNHALTDGDDIFNNTTATIAFGAVGADWKLDGVGIDGAADDCTDAIDGWYDDSEGARWEAHTSPVHAVKRDAGTITGLTALKAAHGLVPLDPTDPDLPDWTTSKSKSATQLDENYESDVTLSLPSAEEELVSDVVFVLDKSTSQDKQNAAISMLESLKDQIADTGAKVKVGVVVFNKEAHAVLGLTELNDGNMAAIEEAIRYSVSSGTNTHAGLLAGVKMLDEDTSVEDARKYLVFVSDGITYMYNESPTAILLQNGDKTNVFAGPDNWTTKYGTADAPDNWDEWLGKIGAQIKADGTTYDGPYGVDDRNYIPWDDREGHAMSIDKALYLTYQAYQDAASKYHCYAMAADSSAAESYPWASSFMSFLADGNSVSFDEIQNDIYYLLDAGSSVVDVIGYGTDNLGAEYAFDFVNNLGNLNLTVGGTTLNKEAIDASADENATSAYGFFSGDQSNGSYDFELWYYANGQDGASDECFVWKINTAVSNFAPVQLTYTVKLANPSYLAGEHGAYDEYGTAQLAGLLTNTVATLYPVDSNGNQGVPENFYRPTVSYEVGTVTVRPADMTIYMGGNEGYDTVVNGSGETVVAESTNSLPEPGFYIELPDDINELLREAQGTDNPGATDLSDLIRFYAAGDSTREWKFERYGGDEGSVAYDRFVYRLVPTAEGQDPVRLEFTSGGQTFTSDDFDPATEGALHNEYEMSIYPGDVDLNSILMDITIDGKTYTKVVKVEPGVLDVRYVVDAEDGNPVTGVVSSIDDAAEAGKQAYAVVSPDATFFINGSSIDIAEGAAPSLLFDSVVGSQSEAGSALVEQLLAKADATITGADEGFEATGHEAKYLDLVDANNGNAWLMTDSPVTVYWPYPAGTDETTEFHLVHFQGLDRDMDTDEISAQVDATDPEYIEVTNTEHGVMFTLQPKLGEDGNVRVRFSPFVLAWGASSTTPDPEPEPKPEPVTARFVAQKKLEGATLKDGQFTFELKDKDGKVVANAKNDANGTIVFEGLSFSEAGTYEYTISEVNDGQEGITYDTSVKGCYVKVTEKDGKLVAEAFAREELVFTNTATTTSEPEPEPEPGEPTQPSEPNEPTEPTTPVEPGTPDGTVPNTGDPTSAVAVASLLVAGIGAGAAGIVLRRRSK